MRKIKCRICGQEIDYEKQPTFSYESVKGTGNLNTYHQSCLWKFVAQMFEEEINK